MPINPTRPPTRMELCALDFLDGAQQHLKKQFDSGMTRAVAAAHFEARALIFNAQNKILEGFGAGITRREVQAAKAKHRGGCRG